MIATHWPRASPRCILGPTPGKVHGMPITRKFLGDEQPALAAAADYLLSRYLQEGVADFSNVVVVVPGARAGRRLLELLVARTQQAELAFFPPIVETIGRLPEQLYPLRKPLADGLVQQLAWTSALREIDPAIREKVVPHPPGTDDWPRWLALGDLLRRQHLELASHGLDFADVANQAATLPSFVERPRWLALGKIQAQYLRILDDAELWDVQTARLFAIKYKECGTTHDLILLGVADLDLAMRKILDAVADRVTALVCAPIQWSERFDEHGCLIPEQWSDAIIPLGDDRIRRADRPADQAATMVRELERLSGCFRADEITLGIPDESLATQIVRQLDELHVPARWVNARQVAQTAPYRFLNAVGEYLASGSFRDFANLVRHADVYAWLRRQQVSGDFLSELDRYQNNRLATELPLSWPGDDTQTRVTEVHRHIKTLLVPVAGEPRSLRDWPAAWESLLTTLYQGANLKRNLAADRERLETIDRLHAALLLLRDVPLALAARVPAHLALRMVLDREANNPVPQPASGEELELLGWLELPLDDAPVLIVSGLNEGIVPQSRHADLFLPNQLRTHLQIEDNRQQYARDAYALSLLLQPWRQTIIIFGCRSAAGDPLAPSRLLFAADPEVIAARAKTYFDHAPPAVARPLLGGVSAPPHKSRLVVPQPQKPIAVPDRFSVTGFRSYLACRYRFYLKQVLKLKALADQAEELDGGAFGILLHNVLGTFGQDPNYRDITDGDQLGALFSHLLDAAADAQLGRHRLTAVNVQVEQLRLRLQAFATWQAQWRAAGWRIAHVEGERDLLQHTWQIDGQAAIIEGRIDRIDQHQSTGGYAILDYKTSDSGQSPEQAHHDRQGVWHDLQLPLYRHLAKSLDIEGDVQLGYVVLPKDLSKVGLLVAEWSQEQLNAADEVAMDVIRSVRQQAFWPPIYPPPSFSDDFAGICQDAILGRVMEAFDGEEELR